MTDFDLVFRGKVVSFDRVMENAYIAVSNGKVALVGQGEAPGGRENASYDGCWLFPGVIDSPGSQPQPERAGGFRPVDACGGGRRGDDNLRHAVR